jgi:hypothetical protein
MHIFLVYPAKSTLIAERQGNTNDFHDILEILERFRQEVNKIATEKSLIDPEVLAINKKLDKALNQYQKLLCKKKK